MELVYLWVEDYKNIKKQGFNFSPRFRCEYDEETEELEVIDKEETKEPYLKNFFGDNINVTAIVGENGSGKSSLLLNIPSPEYIKGMMRKSDYILVYLVENKIKVISNIKLVSKYKIDKLYSETFDYFSFNQDFLSPEFINNFSSYFSQTPTFNNNVLSEIYINSNHAIDLYKYHSIINRLIFKYSFLENIFLFNVKEIKLSKSFGNIQNLFNILKSSLEKENYAGEYQSRPINIYEYLSTEFKDFSEKEQFLLYILLKHYQNDKDVIKIIHSLFEDSELMFIDLKEEIFNYKNENLNIEIFKEFYNLIDEDIYDKNFVLEELKNEISKVEIVFEDDIQYLLNINLFDDIDRNFKDLSQGERHIVSLVLLIYNRLSENKNKNKLILLDEIDITLHPTWQKKLINILIKIFTKLKEYKIHFIVSSHSPFILSDIPKENVIFLEKDVKIGNCINSTNKVDLNPFGANIHTLLSHGFFMKDGLMGEFAKNKIDEVIKYLNNESSKEIKSNDDAQSIINIIGEPIIKRELQRKLDSKRLSKIDKIDEIEKQMKIMEEQRILLEYRLESIRKNQ